MSAPAVAAISAAEKVHVQIAGFQALSEQGHWDACAVVAEIDAVHVCAWGHVALIENSINAWRWQYVQNHRWTFDRAGKSHGTSLAAIYWHLTETAVHARIAGYIPYTDAPDAAYRERLHTLLIQQAARGNPLIVQVCNAQALPRAEQGVKSHFVAVGGIDSDLGYWTANGDTLDAIQHAPGALVPCQWVSWRQFLEADIRGAIALERETPPPPPSPPSPETPPDGAEMAVILKQLSDTVGTIQNVVTALRALQG